MGWGSESQEGSSCGWHLRSQTRLGKPVRLEFVRARCTGGAPSGRARASRGRHTLYLFAKDRNGKSASTGICARFWSALLSQAGQTKGEGISAFGEGISPFGRHMACRLRQRWAVLKASTTTSTATTATTPHH
jgi:hypothetical protein